MIRENVMDIENIVIGDENGKRKIGSMMNTKNTNSINWIFKIKTSLNLY